MAGQSDLIERIARQVREETPDDSSDFYVDYDDYAIHLMYEVETIVERGGSYEGRDWEKIVSVVAEKYNVLFICQEDGEDIPHMALALEKKLNA